MSYLVCDKCGEYYELQSGESPEDPQNLRFWDPKTKFSRVLRINVNVMVNLLIQLKYCS